MAYESLEKIDMPKRVIIPCLLVSLVGFGLFGGIAWNVKGDNELTRLDVRLADSLNDFQLTTPALGAFFNIYTGIGSRGALAVVVAAVAVVLIWRRQYVLAAAWLSAVASGCALNEWLKDIFHRTRPPFAGATGGSSFPSGHAMGSMIGYGFLAYLLVLALPRRWSRIAVVAVLSAAVLLIGFSRLYLGKHYLSDVLGAFSFSAAWLAGWIALLEVLRKPKTSAEKLLPRWPEEERSLRYRNRV